MKNIEIDKKEIISVIIDMSCQSDGIIKFGETDNIIIINKPIQIYLHRLNSTEKYLKPIIITNSYLHKLYNVLSSLKLEGYTKYKKIQLWIIENNIKNYIIFD